MLTPVISGVGVVSAYGFGAPAFFAGLREGRNAIRPIRHLDASGLPTRVAGEVPMQDDEALPLLERSGRETRQRDGLHRAATLGVLRDRKAVFAALAALEAFSDARCGDAERDAALILGLGLEQAFLDDFLPLLDGDRAELGRDRREPLIRLRAPVDLSALLVRSLLELRGATVVSCAACAAGTLAVAQAATWIARGQAEVVVCGASDSMVNPLGLGGMSRLSAPSPRAEADACRPFDLRRDGLVIGEGAAVFVLESEARARARGARIYARVLGWGSTQDGYRATAPRPDGSAAARAIQKAMTRAQLAPQQVGYINAHGTGTPLNDPAEALAIRTALGDATDAIYVSSIKGAIGHLMAAAGAVELAACLLAFSEDLLPATTNLTTPDPSCALRLIGPRPQPARIDALLKSSFGFGGQNACVALGRP